MRWENVWFRNDGSIIYADNTMFRRNEDMDRCEKKSTREAATSKRYSYKKVIS